MTGSGRTTPAVPTVDRRMSPGSAISRPSQTSRASRYPRLSPREWANLGGVGGFILLLHVVGWLTLLLVVVPRHFSVGGTVFGVGIGITAYTLGMRHAFDADHISAIDNTTRKLMADGERPLTVGFWFSLGHSSVVFGLAALIGFGYRALAGPVQDDHSALHQVAALVGTSVSGVFLYLIAVINLVVLAGILKVFAGMRRGEYREDELERHLDSRGFMNRFLGRFARAIRAPWQMYPLGVLFGLGFDTATEIALLFLAAGAAGSGLPWYAILCLPILFAAGMSLLDTIDGSFMNFAYGWAFSQPVRKIYYNIVVTALSIVVALLIGTVELLNLLISALRLTGPFWDWIAGIDLNTAGYAIVGLFVVTWVVAIAVWRFGGIEAKWTANVTPAEQAD